MAMHWMDMYELRKKHYDYRTGEAKWSGLDQIKASASTTTT